MMLMIIFFVDQNLKNKSLSEILDIKKLENVNKPIEAANGLPNECYISEDYLAYEKEKIFCDKWTCWSWKLNSKSRRCQTIQSTGDSS